MAGLSGWFGRDASSGALPEQERSAPVSEASLMDKLREYHSFTRDALSRALNWDENGDFKQAATCYKMALQGCVEGLKLPIAPSSGLGPRLDTVAGWRSDLETYKSNITERLDEIQSGRAASERRSAGTAGARRSATTTEPSRVGVRVSAPAAAARGVRQRSSSGGGANRGGVAEKPAASEFRKLVESEILDTGTNVRLSDVAGLAAAKQALQEAVVLPMQRPDLFRGLRAPVKGILLYGPPGNGKTMLAKALATESQATFFNISASALVGKFLGDSEKMVRALFEVAEERAPSIVFIDEIDSILTSRSANEHEASRRLKTEFLVQFDGVTARQDNHVLVLGATNRPQELDEAARRRLVKRIYLPLPDAEGRAVIIQHLLREQEHQLDRRDIKKVVERTQGYSGSDLTQLCKEAAMVPLRKLAPGALASMPASRIRKLRVQDLLDSLQVIKPSVSEGELQGYEEWTKQYGVAA